MHRALNREATYTTAQGETIWAFGMACKSVQPVNAYKVGVQAPYIRNVLYMLSVILGSFVHIKVSVADFEHSAPSCCGVKTRNVEWRGVHYTIIFTKIKNKN